MDLKYKKSQPNHLSPYQCVCSQHFVSKEVTELADLGGRRRLKPGAVPVLLPWNDYSLGVRRLGVWERRARPEIEQNGEDVGPIYANDHDYGTAPDPTFFDAVRSESIRKEIVQPRQQLEQLSLKQRFGLHRFSGSDRDIRFYTRFSSYDHLMRFWQLIEPSLQFMVRVSRARTPNGDSAKSAAMPIDELFLFLNYLALGLKQRELADRYGGPSIYRQQDHPYMEQFFVLYSWFTANLDAPTQN
ncbi:uncharacterized protein LOC127648178 isoform X2 [Xyrauchen texanus]|uniref:uncharacterized protein LOC127648178 isoform X2 n=1 Tax=Xyrauchen texanus TaxID=154827 RepID=UPI0022428313|nr:uncharacterized protein LOC127648178 isoform X2 [Xyrauchen texanus]